MTTGPETREPEYSSDIASDVDCLAGGGPLDPLAAPVGAEIGPDVAGAAVGQLVERVTVRVPAAEAARWRDEAAAAGVSVSDWMRARLAQPGAVGLVTGRPTPRQRPVGRARVVRADPEVVAQLTRVGNNVNQLARWCNTERRYLADLAQLVAIGRELDRVVAVLTAWFPAADEALAEVEDVEDLVVRVP